MQIKLKIKYLIIKLIQIIFKKEEKQCNEFNKSQINKILIIRLDEIGDVIMTIPFIRELRRNFPNAEITLIVKPQTYNLVELCPYVDKVLIFNKFFGKFAFFVNIIKSYNFSKNFLIKKNFDLVIVPRYDVDIYCASYLAFFSRAKIRVAYSEYVTSMKKTENKGYNRFFTHIIDDSCYLHEVERNLNIICFFKGDIVNKDLEIWLDDNDKRFKNNKNKILIAISTVASRDNKEWNINNYKKLITYLNKNINIDIVLIGNGDRAVMQAKFLEKNCDIKYNFVNKTTLRESLGILQKCDLYLGGDTGPTHMAAAVGLNGIALYRNNYSKINFGYDSPERFGPWNSKIITMTPRNIYFNQITSIDSITVDDVYKILNKLLKKIKNNNHKFKMVK